MRAVVLKNNCESTRAVSPKRILLVHNGRTLGDDEYLGSNEGEVVECRIMDNTYGKWLNAWPSADISQTRHFQGDIGKS